MKLATLQDLYVEELRDLYDAEHQLVKALPKMAKGAHSLELQSSLEEHLDVTNEQINRLEQIFERLDVKPKGKKCEAMKGLIDEGKNLMDMDGADDVLDAGMIACAQKIEHYEIAGYGCVRTYAELLGFDEDAELLQETLDEEKETDGKLNDLAKSTINIEAMEQETEAES
jgi:ferritin-like metal-binding protein YciE